MTVEIQYGHEYSLSPASILKLKTASLCGKQQSYRCSSTLVSRVGFGNSAITNLLPQPQKLKEIWKHCFTSQFRNYCPIFLEKVPAIPLIIPYLYWIRNLHMSLWWGFDDHQHPFWWICNAAEVLAGNISQCRNRQGNKIQLTDIS